MQLRTALVLVFLGGEATADKLERDTLQLPASEVKTYDAPIQLPVVPSFELPSPEPGYVDPRMLRVRGKKLLDTEVKVKGYVVWIYDCVADNQRPGMTRAQVQKQIDDDPTRCERPKFFLGATRDTPGDRALWVVDVPRPPNKLEKQRLPKPELAKWPAVPKLKLGDYVVVTGKFALSSPHQESNTDGLVVFGTLAQLKPPKPPKAVPAPAPKPAAVASKPAPAPVKTMRAVVDSKILNTSLQSLNSGNKAFAQKNYVQAVDLYKRAIASWDGNHLAWYGLGGAHATNADWKSAFDAFSRAAKLRPDSAQYQLWSGVTAYEAAVRAAREADAAKRGIKPEAARPDLSQVAFDTARTHLEAAIALEPALWRAHYYLGRIHRDQERDKLAAEAFTAAVAANRQQPNPLIALGELYRKWDYPQHAVAVMTAGAKELPADAAASDVFYVLGMAHDDAGDRKQAIVALTRALELEPDHHRALFQRGWAYFKLGKKQEAKADFEAFLAAPAAASAGFAREQANKMLMDMAGRT